MIKTLKQAERDGKYAAERKTQRKLQLLPARKENCFRDRGRDNGSGSRAGGASAGTGLLVILAEIAGGSAERIGRYPGQVALFPSFRPFPSRASMQSKWTIDPAIVPSVVLMNPPFSAMPSVSRRVADTAYRHIASVLARLADGGPLVTIPGANFSAEAPAWRGAFARLHELGRVVFTAAIAGAVYVKHGTAIETRPTVIDKVPVDDPRAFPEQPGMAPDVVTLLRWIGETHSTSPEGCINRRAHVSVAGAAHRA
ncbi:hypothetical protein ACVIHD_006246 [Bradyrhizobium embrapense]